MLIILTRDGSKRVLIFVRQQRFR